MKPNFAPNSRLMVTSPERLLHPEGRSVEWLISDRPVPYESAMQCMESHVDAMIREQALERVWLLEHPPLYTAGTSSDSRDLLLTEFPVFQTGRGGQMTYHGPGQRIAYVMLDLRARGQDLRRFIAALEGWMIASLAKLNIKGERREDRVGVWIQRPDKGKGREDKIAAIGIRVRQWVTFHGISINIDPDLSHFKGIIPCGVSNPDFGVTSLTDMGQLMLISEFDMIIRHTFEQMFGPTQAIVEKECA